MLKSLVKLILHPRKATFTSVNQLKPLIILGNGPSLNSTLASHREALDENPLLAVNFAANTPVFFDLKPEYYVLADPHFFNNAADPNVRKLIDSINGIDWPMTLFLPFGSKVNLANPQIRIEYFPMIAVEGSRRLELRAYNARRGMPRPRNVLIPSIMIAIWLGFKEIYLTGADHSWPKTLSVTDQNEVVSVQPHFYEEDSRELQRIRVTQMNMKLHELLQHWFVAFRSYHQIQRWAEKIDVKIYNATPDSFIDAFPRKCLK